MHILERFSPPFHNNKPSSWAGRKDLSVERLSKPRSVKGPVILTNMLSLVSKELIMGLLAYYAIKLAPRSFSPQLAKSAKDALETDIFVHFLNQLEDDACNHRTKNG